MKARWESISDSTLTFFPKHKPGDKFLPPPEQINNEVANFELRRLSDAFLFNEGNIADYFKIEDTNNIALGTIDGIQYDWNSTVKNINGFMTETEELLTIQSRPLYNKSTGDKIATVVLSLQNLDKPVFEGFLEQNFSVNKSRCIIEVTPIGFLSKERFVIKTPSVEFDDDEIIDVKGKTKDL